jgi:hypothetical protein
VAEELDEVQAAVAILAGTVPADAQHALDTVVAELDRLQEAVAEMSETLNEVAARGDL